MSLQQQDLDRLATQLFLALEQTGDVLVLAESCTAGLSLLVFTSRKIEIGMSPTGTF